MVSKEKEDLKVLNNKLALVMAVIGLPIFLFWINYSERKYSRPSVIADNSTQICSAVMDGKYGGNDSGGIFYTRDSLIASSSLLIGETLCDSLWKTGLIDKLGEPRKYRLGDLVFPYVLSKKSDNDTLVVHKSGYEFKFLLPPPEK